MDFDYGPVRAMEIAQVVVALMAAVLVVELGFPLMFAGPLPWWGSLLAAAVTASGCCAAAWSLGDLVANRVAEAVVTEREGR